MPRRNFLFAVSTLVGAIIGAGIFGLPYTVARSGFAVGAVYIAAFSVVLMTLNLAYGEVVLRTRQKHRLVGYATHYLGGWAKPVLLFSSVVSMEGALLAYIILGGAFLHLLFGPLLGGSAFFWSLAFFGVSAAVIARGLKLVGAMEFIFDAVLVAALAGICIALFPRIAAQHLLYVGTTPGSLFLPFGVTLFALSGWVVIPELRDFFPTGARRLKSAIVLGSLIPGLLYIIFVAAIIGVSGSHATPDALSGLGASAGAVAVIGALFGLGAVGDSLIIFGHTARQLFHYDFGFAPRVALMLALAPPLVLFALGAQNFIAVLSVVGVVSALVEGSMILACYYRARRAHERTPEYSLKLSLPTASLVVLLFAFGVLAHFWM